MSSAVFCLGFSLLAVTFSHSTIPVFLWSGEQYFGNTEHPHGETNEAFHSDQFIKDFVSILGYHKNEMLTRKVIYSSEESESSFKFKKYVSKDMEIAPKVIVAFIYPKLDSSEVAYSNGAYSLSSDQSSMPLSFLKDSVINSKSSLIVPHVFIDSPFAMPISQQLSTSMASNYKLLSFDSSSWIDCMKFVEHLTFETKLEPKSHRLLIIVKWTGDTAPKMADCAKKLMEKVAHKTSEYVTIMTGDAPRKDVVYSFSEQMYPLSLSVSDLIAPNTANNTPSNTLPSYGVVYLTPNILISLFLGLMLIFILICGVNCLFNIETPQRLSHLKYNIGKQS